MKLSTFLLFLCAFSALAFPAAAQETVVRITPRLLPLEQLIRQIEKQTGYLVVYNNDDLDVQQTVRVKKTVGPVREVLAGAFEGTALTADFERNYIVLRRDTASGSRNARAGSVIVSGAVVDEAGEPVIGANVVETGLSNGTATDENGRFALPVTLGATLKISYMGYIPQEVKVGKKLNLLITLAEDTKRIDEVVVVGYGLQQKKTLTGAVSVVKFDDLETTGIATVSQGLAGKAAGLRVTQVSAQPGGAASIKIRGQAAGGAGSDPLIVIDGFPVGSSGSNLDSDSFTFGKMGSVDNILSSLNPDDIESISVLKDAASTAIYGARAGHGVILITTKRGRDQKAKVTYSGQVSVQTMSEKFQMLGVREFMDMRNRQYYENYLANNGLGIYAGYITPNETPPAYEPYYTNDQMLRAEGTDWLGLVTRTGAMQQHNLQVAGGSNRSRYLVSLNYMKQAGIVKRNDMHRLTGRFNFDQDFGKYASAGLTVTYSQNKFDNVPLGNNATEYSGVIAAAVQANPANPVYDGNGDYYIDPLRSSVPNPVSLLDYTDVSVNDRLLASGHVILKPVKGLELKAQLGVDRRFQKRSSYIPKTTVEGQRQNGAARVTNSDASDYMLDLNATYTKEFHGHRVKGLLGYAFQIYNSEGVEASARDFLTDAFLYHNMAAGSSERQEAASSASKRSIASYFGRINYSYRDKYLAEVTLRADGSSNFAPENRWGCFPSAALGWVFSEEAFLKKASSWLSNGKVRVSYGATGNENVGYGLQNTYSIDWRNAVIGGAENKGAYVSALGNKDLTWETTTELNLGLDLGFFDQRIQLTLEYFDRQVSDMLQGGKPIPSYNEVTTIVANAGKVQSRGVEVTLNTVNIRSKDLEWNTTLTLSHYDDRWKERPSFIAMKPYQKNDDPLNAWWAYEAVGIMQPGDPAPAAQKDLLPGMVVLNDRNDDGVLDDYDRVYQGSGAPRLYFGLNNTWRYRNFDFNIYFYGETGNRRGASYLENWT